MNNVDERIVKMTFDNDEFEEGIKESSESLTKFKESLNKDTMATGLQTVSDTLSKMSFSSVLSGIESMTSRFSVFGISAATVIQDVTRKIESMADAMVSAVTVDPVKAGWEEYELKMNSVQTIMASTGEDISVVNQYLDELNQYADDTIYSFSDMTESIGKFTNSGVSLDDAVTAIKGISNEAAVSGASANEASRAMYNFAQALSTGYVALIDWKSIENANMATKEFKEQLLETAAACGTVEKTSDGMYKVLTTNNNGSTLDDAIDATNGFRDSLSYQWMTTEVLIETLKDYGDATTEIGAKASAAATEVKTFSMLIDTLKEAMGSGWTETWETIFGDLEVAKAGWTSVSEALGAYIDKASDARNDKLTGAMSTNWSKLQQKFIDAGVDVDDFNSTMTELAINTGKVTQDMIDDVGGLENTISEGWLTTDLLNEAINKLGGTTDDSVSDATSSLEDYKTVVEDIIKGAYGNGSDRTSALEELGYDAEQLQTIVNAVWDGSTLNWDNYTEEALIAAGATEEEAEALMDLKKSLNLTDDEMSQLVDDINSGKKGGTELLWKSITNTIEGLGRILGSVGQAWHNVFGSVTSDNIYNIVAAVEKFTEKLLINKDTVRNLRGTFEGLFSILSIVKTTFTSIGSRVLKAFFNTLGKVDFNLLEFTGNLGYGINKFREWYESNDIAGKALDALIPLFKKAGNGIKSMVGKAAEIPEISAIIEGLKNVFANLNDEIQNGFPTVQKFFSNFIDWLGTLDELTLDDVKQTFKDLFTTLKDGKLLFEFPSLDKLKEKFPKITAEIEKFFNKIKNFDTPTLDKISEKFSDLFDAFKNGDSSFKFPTLTELSEIFPTAASIISTAIEKLRKAFEILSGISISDGVAWFIEDIKTIIGATTASAAELDEATDAAESVNNTVTILDTLKEAFTNLKSVVGDGKLDIDVGAIEAAIVGVLSVVSVFKLLNAVSKFANTSKSIGGFFDSLTNVMKKVTTVTDTAEEATQTETAASSSSSGSGIKKLRSIVISIGILAIALIELGKQPTENLIKAGVVVTAMMAVILIVQALSGLLSKKNLSGSIKGYGTTILAMAIGLKVMVSALKTLSNIDYTVADAGVLAGMMAALIVACGVLQTTNSTVLDKGQKSANKTALNIIAMTVALKLIVSALSDLTEIDWTWKDVGVLGGMFAALIAAVILLSKFGGGVFGVSLGTAATLIAIPLALKILIGAFDDLAALDLDLVISSILKLVIIVGEMAVMLAATKIGKGTSGGGTTILAMASSLILIVLAMKMLATLEGDDLIRVTGAMAVLELCLTAFIGVANTTAKTASAGGKIKSGASSMLAAAVAIAAMAAAMIVLAQLDEDKLELAMEAILSLALSFTAMEAFSGKTGNGSTKNILYLAAVVAVLATAVGLLANLTDASNLKNATNCLTQLMVVMSVMMLISKTLGKFDKTGMASMVVSLGTLTLVVVALAAVAGALTNFTDADDLSTTATSLTELMLGLSVMMVAMKAMPSNFKSLGVKCAGIAAIVGELTLLAAAFGGLRSAFGDDTMEWLKNGAQDLGGLIGGFVGGFISEVITDTLEALPNVLTDLTSFVKALDPFLASLSGIDETAVANGQGLASMLVDLGKTELLDALSYFITKGKTGMESLATGLTGFGDAMAAFAESTADLTDGCLDDAIACAEDIADLFDYTTNFGGVVGFFGGNPSWTKFSYGLAKFGTALSEFSTNVSGDNALDADAISVAVTAGIALAGLHNSIKKVGGILDAFTGIRDWATISTNLPAFGAALGSFSKTLETHDFDAEAVSGAATAADSLVTLWSNMPDAATLSDKFGSSEQWDSISVGMGSLCGLMSYVSGVTGVSSDNIDTMSTAAAAMKTFKNEAPTVGGLKSVFVPTFTTWEAVTSGITSFIDMLKDISSSANGVSVSNIGSIARAGQYVKQLQTAIPKGTALKLLNGFKPAKTTWTNVGNAIKKFITMLESISVDTEINTTNIDTLKTAASSLKQLKKNMPDVTGWADKLGDDESGTGWGAVKTGLESFGQAMEAFSDYSTNIDIEAMEDAISVLQDMEAIGDIDLSVAGEDAITSVFTGMTTGSETVVGAMPQLAEDLIDALSTALNASAVENQPDFNDPIIEAIKTAILAGSSDIDTSSYETVGESLVSAIGSGVSDNESKVSTAASSAVTAGSQAINNDGYLKFYTSGVYLMMGLAQGISDNAYRAINAAIRVASETINAVNTTWDENSPSKISRQSGQHFSMGLALGIKDLADNVASESESVGKVALSALSTVADNIDALLNDDLSYTPMITPVLDLSEVSSGASAIQGMLGRSYGLNIDTANIDRLSGSMSQIQNGTGNEDVVSAISKLNKTMSRDRQNIYNLSGITYDDGSNVASAVQALVRASRMERRA